MVEPNDGQLLKQVRQGNLDAFEGLYHRYKGVLFRTAVAITGEPEVAEEILQETFLRLYRHAGGLDTERPLGPWLHRVTVNLCYNWSTRKRRWLEPLEGLLDRLVDWQSGTPADKVASQELRTAVQDALNSLSIDQRVTLILHYLNNLSVEEIAYVMDCPVGTVKSRLFYGRESLRRKLLGSESAVLGEVGYGFAQGAV